MSLFSSQKQFPLQVPGNHDYVVAFSAGNRPMSSYVAVEYLVNLMALFLSSVKLMGCDHVVPSIKSSVFKDYDEGLTSKPESCIEPKKKKKRVNTIADGLYQLDSIVFGQHPTLQTSELEVGAAVV